MKLVSITILTLMLGMTSLSQSVAEPLGENDVPAGITDPGHFDPYPRFLADVNNDGIKDYCRVVGDKPNLYLSCAFGERKGFSKNEYAFNSEAAKTNFGHPGTAWMEDVNGDGRMDFCRQVGAEPTKYYAAMLAGPTEFSRNQFTRIKQATNGKWAIAPAASNPPAAGQGVSGGSSAGSVQSTAAPSAQFSNYFIDYNVTRNGRKGMLLHGAYTVRNALGKPMRMVANFQFADGGLITALDPSYRSSQGTVMATTNFTPSYAVSNYADTEIFVPYSALSMDGKMRLKVHLSIYDVNAKRHIVNSNAIVFNYNGN